MVKGWNRGLVDGGYTLDDEESWGTWADSVADQLAEATLLQLLVMTERGWFDEDSIESEVE